MSIASFEQPSRTMKLAKPIAMLLLLSIGVSVVYGGVRLLNSTVLLLLPDGLQLPWWGKVGLNVGLAAFLIVAANMCFTIASAWGRRFISHHADETSVDGGKTLKLRRLGENLLATPGVEEKLNVSLPSTEAVKLALRSNRREWVLNAVITIQSTVFMVTRAAIEKAQRGEADLVSATKDALKCNTAPIRNS